jgi:uncharacterized protein
MIYYSRKMKSPIHLEKRGIRALAIAESFKAYCRYAVLAGVVMRRDMIIDGVVMSKSTLRGDDATQNIIAMYRNMHRNDVSCIFLGGIIISMYNIVDGAEIHKSTKLPIIALTFRPSEGIERTRSEAAAISKSGAKRRSKTWNRQICICAPMGHKPSQCRRHT